MHAAEELVRVADERADHERVRTVLAWGVTPADLREALLIGAGVHPVDANFWKTFGWRSLDPRTQEDVQRVARDLWPIVTQAIRVSRLPADANPS